MANQQPGSGPPSTRRPARGGAGGGGALAKPYLNSPDPSDPLPTISVSGLLVGVATHYFSENLL